MSDGTWLYFSVHVRLSGGCDHQSDIKGGGLQEAGGDGQEPDRDP